MKPTVLIIGGGVSGSVCALSLRRQGIEVDLAEKSIFPRSKVCGCCIGGTGLSVLRSLQVDDWVSSEGQRLERWVGSMGGYRVEVPLDSGVAISRERLDTELLLRVKQAGANVMVPVSAAVQSLDRDHVSVLLEDSSGENQVKQYDLVIVASGLNATGANRLLPWKEPPHGPFGISFYGSTSHLSTGSLGMACDRDGYVGVVRLEDGRVDIAAALKSGSDSRQVGKPVDRVLGILERSRLELGGIEVQSRISVTPPLRRSRLAGKGRLVAIGDASGYVEPFTGEGMTWGMMSGVAVSRLITESSLDELGDLGDRWCRRQKKLLASKRRVCRLLTTALQNSILCYGTGFLLSRMPSLASPLVSHLARPWNPTSPR